MNLATLSLILSAVALIPVIAYYLRWQFYSPRLFVRVGGDQQGQPISVPSEGMIQFAIGTKSRRRVYVTEVWVGFDEEGMDLSETKGAGQRFTTEHHFPRALLFSEKRIVIRRHLQGNHFVYRAKAAEFAVRFVAVAEVDEAEMPFLLDMFPPPKRRLVRTVRFRTTSEPRTLQQLGLAVQPGEALHVEGIQAQEAAWAATDKGEAQVIVREIIDDGDKRTVG